MAEYCIHNNIAGLGDKLWMSAMNIIYETCILF